MKTLRVTAYEALHESYECTKGIGPRPQVLILDNVGSYRRLPNSTVCEVNTVAGRVFVDDENDVFDAAISEA